MLEHAPVAIVEEVSVVGQAVLVDTTGDGKPDAVENAPGGPSAHLLGMPMDTTGDGMDDALGYDTTGDGVHDKIYRLPVGWSAKLDNTGKLFFVHAASGTTHATAPVPTDAGWVHKLWGQLMGKPPVNPNPIQKPLRSGEPKFIQRVSCIGQVMEVSRTESCLTILTVFFWICITLSASLPGQNMIFLIVAIMYYLAYFVVWVGIAGFFPPCCFAMEGGCSATSIRNPPHEALMRETVPLQEIYGHCKLNSQAPCKIIFKVECFHEHRFPLIKNGRSRGLGPPTRMTSYREEKVFPAACFDASDDANALLSELTEDMGDLFHTTFSYTYDFETEDMKTRFDEFKCSLFDEHKHRDKLTEVTAELTGVERRGPAIIRKGRKFKGVWGAIGCFVLNLPALMVASYLCLLLPYLWIYNILAVPITFRCKKTFKFDIDHVAKPLEVKAVAQTPGDVAPPLGAHMEITVKQITGEIFTIQVSPSDSIAIVIMRIREQHPSLKVQNFQLSCGGNRLKEAQTLDECGINRRDEVFLVPCAA